jgi:dihydroneopterin aldolase
MQYDIISLEGMRFIGHHGVYQDERNLGQPFEVSLAMACSTRVAGLNDDLSQTVDYAQVCLQVQKIIEGEPVHLIETLAERIASTILNQHEQVFSVRVKVAKPHVRLSVPGVVASVEIERDRSKIQPS